MHHSWLKVSKEWKSQKGEIGQKSLCNDDDATLKLLLKWIKTELSFSSEMSTNEKLFWSETDHVLGRN